MSDLVFTKTLAELALGVTAASVMTDCETHGMSNGCTVDCPVLRRGECELQDEENKELYINALREGSEV